MLIAMKKYYAKIPSDLDIMKTFLSEALDFVEHECMIRNETDLFEIRVIISELLLNGILHGNKEDKRKEIGLGLSLTKDNHIYISVEDEGPGYDYKRVIERGSCITDETGRGIHIVRSLSEKVIFNRAGNKITAVKRVQGGL